MDYFFTGNIAIGEKKHGLEEQHRWAQGSRGNKDWWQQNAGEIKQKKGQRY